MKEYIRRLEGHYIYFKCDLCRSEIDVPRNKDKDEYPKLPNRWEELNHILPQQKVNNVKCDIHSKYDICNKCLSAFGYEAIYRRILMK